MSNVCHTIVEQVILPDYLPDNPYSPLIQPVWCSYANGARPAVLISASGTIFFQQEWLNTDDLGIAIDAYWDQAGQGTWDGGDIMGKPRSPSKTKTAGKVLKNLEGRRGRGGTEPASP